jgi:uncharacterized protein YdaU (DUF1376 family)
MDYYRRYVGDYLKKTLDLSLAEDGAYGRLLDHYYAVGAPLPSDFSKLFDIARVRRTAERDAVRRVIEKHFYLAEDGLYHNHRSDQELAQALPKIEKMREVARENGKKGGRPKKPKQVSSANQNGFKHETESGSYPQPELVPTRASQATANHQPPTKSKTYPQQAPPGIETTEPPHTPLALAEAKLNPDTPAAILAAVCVANSIRATAFHPLVVQWASEGVTIERLKSAIATAKQRKGDASIPIAYLDPILGDDSKPAQKPWKNDDAEAEALCAKLGIRTAKPGESREAWHQRIETALAEQARAKIA